MESNTETLWEPNLEPIWTQYQNPGENFTTTTRNPLNLELLTSSPISPKSLANPMYCTSYTASPSRQERILVKSFDGHTKKSKSNFGTNPTLNAIDEEVPLVESLESITILLPIHMGHGADPLSPAPSSAPLPSLRHRHESIHRSNSSTSTRHDRHNHVKDSKLYRRNSTAIYSRPHSPSLTPPPKAQPDFRRLQSAAAEEAEATRIQLRSWGPIYHGNAQTADAFVVARSLRRRTSTSLADGGGTSSLPSRLTIRAIIRPRDADRQPFLMQRNFDMDALRATIPEPEPERDSPPGGSGIRVHSAHAHHIHHHASFSHSPDSPDIAAPPVVLDAGYYRSSSAGGLCAPPKPPLGIRRSSLRSSELLSARGAAASGGVAADYENLVQDVRAVPVHLKYARAFLPLLAALLLSGHVRESDVIYLPLPFAEAWPETARYIYTGLGELSAPVRENIIYLAGKV